MSLTVTAVKRTTKGPATRYAGQLPAVVYGAGGKSESIALSVSDFSKLYKVAGESTLVDMTLDGKDAGKVIIQEVQVDPLKGRPIHVDFRRIDMNKLMHAPVTLKFVGEAPVIKAQGGTLVTSLQTVTVECLPKDLVSHIDISINGLNTYEDVIKIKDLVLPAGVKVIAPSADSLVAKATRALTEEELKALEEKNAAADVSKIESAKPEKVAEEGAEGAEAAPAAEKKEEKKEEKK